MRFTRLKDTIVPIAPLSNDMKFRVAHDAKRLYYCGEQNGVKRLVIVHMKDLSYEVVDLGAEASNIFTLEKSSLFRNFLCYMREEKKEFTVKERVFYKMVQNFFVIDLANKKLIWELPNCETVFFLGQDSLELNDVDFKDRKEKLRAPDEEQSEFEDGDEDGPRLVLDDDADTEDDELSDGDEHTDKMQ